MSSIANTPAGNYQLRTDGQEETWQASLTEKEAAKHGVPKALYTGLYVWARTVVEFHQRLGTPRHLWEAMPTHNEQLVGPYIEGGEQELASRLKEEVDPVIDDVQAAAEETKVYIDTAAQEPHLFTTPESGSTYGADDAVEVINAANAKIEAGFRAGLQHHRRVPAWVVTISRWLPWVEALGLLGFIAYFLDVPLLRPWEDWLGFSLGLTIVAAVIYGQTHLVHGGGEKHNAAREASADGNRREAERSYSRRNHYIMGAATIAVGITAGIIMRGTAALGDASATVITLLIFLAVLAGALMPLVTYLAIARDGSQISRERDSLAADLDADLDNELEQMQQCRSNLASIAEAKDTLVQKLFPDICNGVQETVDGAYTPYNTGRILIGHLAADPPTKTSRTLHQDTDGCLHGEISTGIPGTRSVNLGPLFDRVERMAQLDRQRTDLQRLLDARPVHPRIEARKP
jgi:hypothetical protein